MAPIVLAPAPHPPLPQLPYEGSFSAHDAGQSLLSTHEMTIIREREALLQASFKHDIYTILRCEDSAFDPVEMGFPSKLVDLEVHGWGLDTLEGADLNNTCSFSFSRLDRNNEGLTTPLVGVVSPTLENLHLLKTMDNVGEKVTGVPVTTDPSSTIAPDLNV
nr:tubby-related protein 1-like isoform X1 [Ipomoea batatas]